MSITVRQHEITYRLTGVVSATRRKKNEHLVQFYKQFPSPSHLILISTSSLLSDSPPLASPLAAYPRFTPTSINFFPFLSSLSRRVPSATSIRLTASRRSISSTRARFARFVFRLGGNVRISGLGSQNFLVPSALLPSRERFATRVSIGKGCHKAFHWEGLPQGFPLGGFATGFSVVWHSSRRELADLMTGSTVEGLLTAGMPLSLTRGRFRRSAPLAACFPRRCRRCLHCRPTVARLQLSNVAGKAFDRIIHIWLENTDYNATLHEHAS